MENPTSYAGQGQGCFGKLDCLKYSLPTCFSQIYFAVLSLLHPLLPGLMDVFRETWL